MVSAAPPERAGTAAAISETSSELGGALGIAILGSIGIAAYRHTLAAGLPDGLPAAVAHAALSVGLAVVVLVGLRRRRSVPGQPAAAALPRHDR